MSVCMACCTICIKMLEAFKCCHIDAIRQKSKINNYKKPHKKARIEVLPNGNLWV